MVTYETEMFVVVRTIRPSPGYIIRYLALRQAMISLWEDGSSQLKCCLLRNQAMSYRIDCIRVSGMGARCMKQIKFEPLASIQERISIHRRIIRCLFEGSTHILDLSEEMPKLFFAF